MRNKGKNQFEYLPPATSGFIVGGDAKALISIKTVKDKSLLVASENPGQPKVFSGIRQSSRALKKGDAFVLLNFSNGSKRKEEFY